MQPPRKLLWKRCEIKVGGQEMALMVDYGKILITTIQVNLCYLLQDLTPNSPVSILTGRQKTWFSHLCSSKIAYPNSPNLLQGCAPGRGIYIPNLKQIAPASPKIQVSKNVFNFLCKFGKCILQCSWNLELIKVHLSIKLILIGIRWDLWSYD